MGDQICKHSKILMFALTNPKPSSEVSNSTNEGVTADPCRRMSWGVVMDTRHLTRVRGTVLPSAERTRLRLMRYWPLSSAGVAKTLSGPKPSMDMVILSVKSRKDRLNTIKSNIHGGKQTDLYFVHVVWLWLVNMFYLVTSYNWATNVDPMLRHFHIKCISITFHSRSSLEWKLWHLWPYHLLRFLNGTKNFIAFMYFFSFFFAAACQLDYYVAEVSLL